MRKDPTEEMIDKFPKPLRKIGIFILIIPMTILSIADMFRRP